MTKYIYISPHLDDAIFSCGGIIHEQHAHGDEVEVWTVFSADPPADVYPYAKILHERWGENQPYRARRQEDQNACDLLGVKWVHLPFLDCIYRSSPGTENPLINENQDLFSETLPSENELTEAIRKQISTRIEKDAILLCPLAIGGHVDHRITRRVAEQMQCERWYYPDFPYAAKNDTSIHSFVPEGALPIKINLTPAGLQAWQEGIASYPSQMSSFWQSLEEMQQQVRRYSESPLACVLWKKEKNHQ